MIALGLYEVQAVSARQYLIVWSNVACSCWPCWSLTGGRVHAPCATSRTALVGYACQLAACGGGWQHAAQHKLRDRACCSAHSRNRSLGKLTSMGYQDRFGVMCGAFRSCTCAWLVPRTAPSQAHPTPVPSKGTDELAISPRPPRQKWANVRGQAFRPSRLTPPRTGAQATHALSLDTNGQGGRGRARPGPSGGYLG